MSGDQAETVGGTDSALRLVLDTNILVACALMGEGAARRNLAMRDTLAVARAKGRLFGSTDTLAELRAVLSRADFDRYCGMAERQRFLETVDAETVLVAPAPVGRLCRDPEDDMFLAVAVAADADFLVTVDRQLLSVRAVGRCRVLRPERFLEAAGDGEKSRPS